MATDLTPVRSDFEVEEDDLFLHGANIQDDGSISSDDSSIPSLASPIPLKEILRVPDTQPIYSLRKRSERKGAFTFLDQDTSGNFDPAEERRKLEKSKQCLSKSRRRKLSKICNATNNKDKPKSRVKQQNTAPSPRKTTSRKFSVDKVQNNVSKPRGNAKPRKPENLLRPEDYLTEEDFKFFEDSDEIRKRIQLASRLSSPEVLEDSAGHKGVVTKINTSFTHPIEFDIEHANPDCNFCELSTYGFVGSFEKEIYCIRWDNGLGFTQLNGGDAESTTTMCQTCTMERVQIVVCVQHEIQRINLDLLDFTEAFNELLTQEEHHMIKQQLSRWCSMCFSPATYVCRRPQESLLTNEGGIDGCGLKLCTPCEMKFREVFGGDISAMATSFDQESKTRESDQDLYGKVRADVGFLCWDGILMRNVENAADECVDQGANI